MYKSYKYQQLSSQHHSVIKENPTSDLYPVKRCQSQLPLVLTGCAEQPTPSQGKNQTTPAGMAASPLSTGTLLLGENCCIMYPPNATGDCIDLENAAVGMTNTTTES